MDNQHKLIGIYICYLLIQIYIVKNYILNWQSLLTGQNFDEMNYNLSHKPELANTFTDVVASRIKMLEHMDYIDWINYNNDHSVIKHAGFEYEMSIFERSKNDPANYLSNSHFTLRVNKNTNNLGLSYVDLLRQTNYAFLFSLFQPNPDFLETIYQGPVYDDNTNIYAHFTLDPSTNRAIKTNVITGVWKKQADNGQIFEGVILIDYGLLDVESEYSNKYFDYMGTSFVVMASIATLITTLLLYHSSKQTNFYMSFIFLSILNIYLIIFMTTTEGVTTLEVENNKVKDINDGILSISFLAAVNIYILQTLKSVKNHLILHNESAFLFTLALVLLLFALYKKTNYNKIDDIRIHRIKKQFLYNTSIFVNLFILFNYLVYVARDGGVINTFIRYLKKM